MIITLVFINMDRNLEILLNSEKNIESINIDSSMKIELSNKLELINEYNIRNVLSVTELYEIERQETEIYRIYGSIEYLSLLNGVRNTYDDFTDFFNPFSTSNYKDIFNSFEFYLVRPAESGYTQNIDNINQYNRFFKVIATPNQFELFKAGFAKNIFDEQTYAFNFSVDVDISALRDEFGMPLTELYLYPQYRRSGLETLSFTRWSNTGIQTTETFTPIMLNVGDYVRTLTDVRIGDYVEYNKPKFNQKLIIPQTFRIATPIEFVEVEDNSKLITLTSTSCNIINENYQNNREYNIEYTQNLTFSFLEPQPNDITIFYRITTEESINNTTPTVSSTTGTTTILAGQTSRTLFNMPCRFEVFSDFSAGGTELYIADITYTLLTTSINEPTTSIESTINVIWKYNPFIPIRLRYFEDYINRVNTGSTSYEDVESIPNYATDLDNGNYVWREIMPEGYVDPITGVGTDHPFVNKKRYVFTKIIFDVTPDLDDENTLMLFEKLWFENDTTLINTRPISDINKLNKPCL